MRQIEISILNVVMPTPHSPRRYVELLKKTASRKRVVQLRGEEAAMLGFVNEIRESPNLIRGEIYRWLEIDALKDWYNTETNAAAEKKDLDGVEIPAHLKPHFKIFDFIFDSRKHRLFVVSRDKASHLSPYQVEKILKFSFNDQQLIDDFGGVKVFAEPSPSELGKIINMANLQRLAIKLETQPNPGDVDDEETELEIKERLEEENARSLHQVLTAKNSNGLSPSPTTVNLARVAQSNGSVEGTGYNDAGKRIELSTRDVPWRLKVPFNPNKESRFVVLLRAYREIVARIGAQSRD